MDTYANLYFKLKNKTSIDVWNVWNVPSILWGGELLGHFQYALMVHWRSFATISVSISELSVTVAKVRHLQNIWTAQEVDSKIHGLFRAGSHIIRALCFNTSRENETLINLGTGTISKRCSKSTSYLSSWVLSGVIPAWLKEQFGPI